jgi:hypothetical protein
MDARFDSWMEARALAESEPPDYEALREEGWPFCDYCGDPMDDSMDGEENDWNGETGCHLSCERDPLYAAARATDALNRTGDNR